MRHTLSSRAVTVGLFFLFLFSAPILIFALPRQTFSEVENRAYASFPSFSLSSIRDKSFMDGMEDYAADHFPGRTGWISLQTKALLAAGQREINGVYVLKDRLIEKIEPSGSNSVKNSLAAMNAFAQRFDGSTYLMLIPTAAEIYGDLLPKGAPTLNEKEVIDSVYGSVRNIGTIDVYASLLANREQYLYYRSDHHWTSRGAYLGYSALAPQMGFTPVSSDSFTVEHASHTFLGSLYSKVVYDGFLADTVDLYSYPQGAKILDVATFDGTEWTHTDSIYHREALEHKDKYQVFLGQNQPIVTVTTDCPGTDSLIIFKDSYTNSLLPFLSLHYKTITLVDLRYLVTSFENYVDLDSYTKALFCFNIKNFTSEDYIRRVNLTK